MRTLLSWYQPTSGKSPISSQEAKTNLIQKVLAAEEHARGCLGKAKSIVIPGRSVCANQSDFYYCAGHGKGKLSRIIKTREAE